MKRPGRWMRDRGEPVRPVQVRSQSLYHQRCAPARVEPQEERCALPQCGQPRARPAVLISTTASARRRAVARAASALTIWAGGRLAMALSRSSRIWAGVCCKDVSCLTAFRRYLTLDGVVHVLYRGLLFLRPSRLRRPFSHTFRHMGRRAFSSPANSLLATSIQALDRERESWWWIWSDTRHNVWLVSLSLGSDL